MDANKIQIVQVPINELTEIINNTVASQISKLIGKLIQNNSPKPDKSLLSREEVSKLLDLSLVTLSKLQKTGIVYHPQRIKLSIVRRVKVNHLQRTKVNH